LDLIFPSAEMLSFGLWAYFCHVKPVTPSPNPRYEKTDKSENKGGNHGEKNISESGGEANKFRQDDTIASKHPPLCPALLTPYNYKKLRF
jgi:hypothetical protein